MPRHLCEGDLKPNKDDVINDIFVLLGSKTLRREDFTAYVAKAVAAHHRMFPTKYAMQSLDAPAYRDSLQFRGCRRPAFHIGSLREVRLDGPIPCPAAQRFSNSLITRDHLAP
jgi:hypothetical protein